MALNSSDIHDNLGNPETRAAHVYNNWVQWDRARKPWKSGIKEVNEYLAATDTTTVTNVASGFNHTTHRPKLTQIYDNLTANYKPGLIPNRKWLKWVGEDDEAVSKANRQLLESYLHTKHRLSGFSKVVDELLDDWVRTGNAFCGVEFVNQMHKHANSKVMQGYKGPKIYRIDSNDIVMNPTASSFEEAPKIIRSVYGIGDLHRKANDIQGSGKEKFVKILERIQRDRAYAFSQSQNDYNMKGPGVEEQEKFAQYTFDGFGSYMQYLTSGLVEVLEYFGDMYNPESGEYLPNRHIVVVDRKYVILDEETKTWNGKPHIYHCGWRKRPNNLWAMGPLENLVGMQYRIDHLENLKADAFDQMLDADTVEIGNVEVGYTETGAKEYTVDEGGDVKRLSPDTTILNADLQIRELEEAMDLYAGSPREAMGFRTPGEKTKFEVSQLMNAAGRIFQHKLERFEEYMIEPVLNAEIEVARDANDYNDTVEMLDPETGAVRFDSISSKDLFLNGKYIPVGARHYSRQQQLAQDARDMLGTISQDPMILEHFSSKKLAQLFEEVMGFDQHELYQEFIRVSERQEAARLQATASEQLEEEDATDITEPDSEETENADPFEEVSRSVPNEV